ncbi:MAG: hypothetical protein ACE5JZ_09050 [Kiloniellales bacterium]
MISGIYLVLAAVLLAFQLQGCAGMGSLWPSLSAEEPVATDEPESSVQPAPANAGWTTPPGISNPPTPAPAAPANAPAPVTRPAPAPPARIVAGAAPPALGTGNFEPQPLTPGMPTGTFVGQRVQQLRADLARLQGSISQYNAEMQQLRARVSQDAQRYRTVLARANSRHQAAAALDELAAGVIKMADLADRAAKDAGLATFLLESVRDAYGLSGAVQEDHRQLAVLEADTNRTAELFGRLLFELRADVDRQSAYLGAERRNLAVVSGTTGDRPVYGPGRAGTAVAAAPAYGGVAPVMVRPLVVIHFDRPNVDYERAVHAAASQALQRRPDAVFDVVAVTPASGSQAVVARNASQAKRLAESVLRSLTNMGLPADRITLSATTSAVVRSNEVHIYVR